MKLLYNNIFVIVCVGAWGSFCYGMNIEKEEISSKKMMFCYEVLRDLSENNIVIDDYIIGDEETKKHRSKLQEFAKWWQEVKRGDLKSSNFSKDPSIFCQQMEIIRQKMCEQLLHIQEIIDDQKMRLTKLQILMSQYDSNIRFDEAKKLFNEQNEQDLVLAYSLAMLGFYIKPGNENKQLRERGTDIFSEILDGRHLVVRYLEYIAKTLEDLNSCYENRYARFDIANNAIIQLMSITKK